MISQNHIFDIPAGDTAYLVMRDGTVFEVNPRTYVILRAGTATCIGHLTEAGMPQMMLDRAALGGAA